MQCLLTTGKRADNQNLQIAFLLACLPDCLFELIGYFAEYAKSYRGNKEHTYYWLIQRMAALREL
ncbi:hypothetical protein ABTN10_19460, partial [Acinetobacter baumannii]